MDIAAGLGVVFIGIFILMMLGIPVAISFGAGAFVLLMMFGVDPVWACTQALHLKSSFVLMCLPLYILLGGLVEFGGVADRLCDFGKSLTGRIKGSLGVAIILANGVFGAMSGSAMAALAGLGKAFLPSLEKEGYPKSYGLALLIPSAVLSTLIPPSGYMIKVGFLGRLSIAKCFLAGIGPGIILMIFLSLTHLIYCRRLPTILVSSKISFTEQLKEIGKSAWRNALTLAIPVVVLGVVYGGFGTVTESAAAGSVYTFLLAVFIYRTIKLKEMPGIIGRAAQMTGAVCILFFFFFVLSRVLIIEQLSDVLLAAMMTLSENKWVLMGMLNILMLFMGMVMDDGSANIVAAVIFLPIAVDMGFNPYHFVAIACINQEFGMITPPVAPLLYLGGHIAGEMPLTKYIKPVMIFLLFAFLPALLLTIFIPEVSTFLIELFARRG